MVPRQENQHFTAHWPMHIPGKIHSHFQEWHVIRESCCLIGCSVCRSHEYSNNKMFLSLFLTSSKEIYALVQNLLINEACNLTGLTIIKIMQLFYLQSFLNWKSNPSTCSKAIADQRIRQSDWSKPINLNISGEFSQIYEVSKDSYNCLPSSQNISYPI